MSSPKFTWDSATAGSLILKITVGAREITWRFRKNTPIEDVQRAFEEIVGELAFKTPHISNKWDKDYVPEIPKEAVWLDEIEPFPDTTTEDESRQALAAKASSVTLEGGDFWGHNDLEDLDLYVLGTGDPE